MEQSGLIDIKYVTHINIKFLKMKNKSFKASSVGALFIVSLTLFSYKDNLMADTFS